MTGWWSLPKDRKVNDKAERLTKRSEKGIW